MANLSSKIQGVSQAAIPPVGIVREYAAVAGTDVIAASGGLAFGGGTVVNKVTIHRRADMARIVWNYSATSAGTAGTSNYRFMMPAGLTIDTDKMGTQFSSGAGKGVVGRITTSDGTNELFFDAYVISSTQIGGRTSGNTWDAANAANFADTTYSVGFYVDVYISEWAGSGIQTANTYQVEYAYNSGTWDAADSTSFAYGAGGGSITGSLAADRIKRVRFQSPIKATDRIEIQVSDDGVVWVPVSGGVLSGTAVYNSVAASGTESCGMSFGYVAGSTTDIDVYVGRYQYFANDDAPSSHWSSGDKWRVVKTSGGIQGFGNATTTTPGLVTLAQLCPTTEWTSFTPSWSANAPTASANYGMYRRVGDSIEVMVDTTWSATGSAGTLYLTLPNSYTVDYNKIPGGSLAVTSGAVGILDGGGKWLDSGGNFRGLSVGVNATTQIAFAENFNSASAFLAGSSMTSSDRLSINFTVPISQMAGSLPGLVSDAQVEYASNNGTWDATGAAGTTVYGTGGAITGGALTSERVKTVRFANAIQASDQVLLEFAAASTGPWFSAADFMDTATGRALEPYDSASTGTTSAGVSLRKTATATDVDVLFGRYQSNEAAGAVAWGAFYWRVKKVKSSISALVDNASTSQAGLVTTSAQSFAGLKDFSTAGITAPTSALGNVFSGTYTPTISNVSGFSSITARQAQYMRVGNVVTVSGAFLANVSDTTDCTGTITLPVARSGNFPASGEGAAGVAVGSRGGGAASQLPMMIYGRSGTQLAQFEYNAGAIDNNQHAFNYTFTYTVA